MILTLEIELSPEDYARIQANLGLKFVTADQLKTYLEDEIRDAIKSKHQPLPLGWLFAVKYYTPNALKPSGYEMHEHIFFKGPSGMGLWPHVPGRPMLVADGPDTLKTIGGAFVVDRLAGIIDTTPN